MMVQQPVPPTEPASPGRFERLAGRNKGHQCKPPGAILRFIKRVRASDIWACSCGQRYRWGIDPLAARFGFQQTEWVRL